MVFQGMVLAGIRDVAFVDGSLISRCLGFGGEILVVTRHFTEISISLGLEAHDGGGVGGGVGVLCVLPVIHVLQAVGTFNDAAARESRTFQAVARVPVTFAGLH